MTCRDCVHYAKCENCRYNKGIVCESPKRNLCVSSIFPKGYEPKEKAVSKNKGS